MKKILSLLFISLLVFGFNSLEAHAHETENVTKFETIECVECETTSIQPRIPLYVCTKCASYNTTTTYASTGSWSTNSTSTCGHYDYGVDVLQQRDVTYKVTCNNCNNSFTLDKVEYRTICR